MNNIRQVIKSINAFGERQVFSPKKRKTIIGTAYLIGVLCISVTSVSLFSVNASKNVETSTEVNDVDTAGAHAGSGDKKNIISGESEVKKKSLALLDEEKIISAEVELLSAGETIDLETNDTIEFASIGGGTLITGILEANSTVQITTSEGKICDAKTNAEGKFGCMFSKSVLEKGGITAQYK